MFDDQHRLLILYIFLKTRSIINKIHIRPRIKWWTIKGDACQTLRNNILDSELVLERCKDVRRNGKTDTSEIFELMAHHMRNVGKYLERLKGGDDMTRRHGGRTMRCNKLLRKRK